MIELRPRNKQPSHAALGQGAAGTLTMEGARVLMIGAGRDRDPRTETPPRDSTRLPRG
jgi:hypothetical protein